MTIWETFCDPSWRIWFEKSLIAKGYSPIQMRTSMDRFFLFLTRIKASGVAREFESITDSGAFVERIDYLFSDLWRDYISDNYVDMQNLFKDYVRFLDSTQAFKGVFVSEEEQNRLDIRFPSVPLSELTEYETEYLLEGKLTLLANPVLISWIRSSLQAQLVTIKEATGLCVRFYGNLLPKMKTTDYAKLVKLWWQPEGRSNKFLITYPDNMQELYHSEDAVRAVIKWYGPDVVMSKHLKIRARDFVLPREPFAHPEEYVRLQSDLTYYFCILGNYKDRLNVMNATNIMCGNKLKIELSL